MSHGYMFVTCLLNCVRKETNMLRELSLDEMEMTSGGGASDTGGFCNGGGCTATGDYTPDTGGGATGVVGPPATAGGGSGRSVAGMINGTIYYSEDEYLIALQRYNQLQSQHGNNNQPNPGPNPQNAITHGTSGVSATNTGTRVTTVGGVDVGIATSGGFPPTGISVTGRMR